LSIGPGETGAGRELTSPVFLHETRAARHYSQGGKGTQGKTVKKAGKMSVFLAIRKSGLKTRLRGRFGSFLGVVCAVIILGISQKNEQGNERFSNWHELEQRVSVTGWDSSP